MMMMMLACYVIIIISSALQLTRLYIQMKHIEREKDLAV